jgi:hypothetical protein
VLVQRLAGRHANDVPAPGAIRVARVAGYRVEGVGDRCGTVGFAGFRSDLYFGLGIIVASGWRLQNPMLNGYTGIMAYLPSRKLSVAIVTTQLPRSAGDSRSYASLLFSKLSAYLTPGHRVSLGGG